MFLFTKKNNFCPKFCERPLFIISIWTDLVKSSINSSTIRVLPVPYKRKIFLLLLKNITLRTTQTPLFGMETVN